MLLVEPIMSHHGIATIHLDSRCFIDTYRVEKYRPIYLDDVVGNTETIERLKIIVKDGNMPHMIISGDADGVWSQCARRCWWKSIHND
jgi:hypothetical protein